MEQYLRMLFLAFSFIADQFLIVNAIGKHPLVPALYVFGSSSVDAGNNNHLNTPARADVWPYGVDFNNVTGRYSNGKNLADFAAIHLGLPLAPPYLNLTDSERKQITTGINYGSGACGILNTTRAGECLSLELQIKYFISTVTKDLPKVNKLKNQKDLHHHLAKSIFLLFIGINDYNSLVNGNISSRFSPPVFADYLLDEISKHIKTLHDLGARKFMVHGVSVCEPSQYTGEHCETRYYRDKLPERLLNLQAKLPGSLFTIYDPYIVRKDIMENHEKYGITNVKDPCYAVGSAVVCPDRSKYHFFDSWGHQTEVSCEIAMKDCFNGTSCSPFTLFELANTHIPSPMKIDL